jgi:hypothetical protein
VQFLTQNLPSLYCSPVFQCIFICPFHRTQSYLWYQVCPGPRDTVGPICSRNKNSNLSKTPLLHLLLAGLPHCRQSPVFPTNPPEICQDVSTTPTTATHEPRRVPLLPTSPCLLYNLHHDCRLPDLPFNTLHHPSP